MRPFAGAGSVTTPAGAARAAATSTITSATPPLAITGERLEVALAAKPDTRASI